MGNSLLDFVMALIRDPDAAARYAADPCGALAAAQLAGVTTADVENLMPVVADSLAAATPEFGAAAEAANVWASGAATAAFDAFDIQAGAQASQQFTPTVVVSPVPPEPKPSRDEHSAADLHRPPPEVIAEPEEVDPVGSAGLDWVLLDSQGDQSSEDPAGLDGI